MDLGRKQLIESHLPLVRSVARRYVGRGAELEDLVQIGALALTKASDRFDPGRGVAFATFAAPAVEGEILRHLRDKASVLRIPRELQRITGELRRCREQLAATLGRAPTVSELASALSADEDDVERALAAERASNAVAAGASEEGIELQDTADPHSDSEDRLLLARGARVLDERERRIVFLRFHADMTERQIASEIGISQAHVSRLLDGALSKLRDELDENDRDTTPSEAVISPPPTPTKRPPEHDDASEHRPADTRIAGVSISQEQENPKPGAEAQKTGTSPSHSGRFLVRMPSTLHEQLARAAEREHVSLNRFVTDVLAASVTSASPTDSPTESPPAEPPPDPPRQSPRALRLALATNLIVVVLAGVFAVALLVLALQRGI